MKPLKVLICTLSQSGTTDKVAQKIGSGLISAGMEVRYHPVLSGPVPDILSFDAIGIGCPAYVFRPPFPVTDFIRSLPDLKKKYFFTFVQYGTNPGATGNRIRKQFRKKHAIDAGYLTTRGADYFIGYLRKGYLFSAGFPGDFEIQTAAEFGVKIAHRMQHGYPETEPYDPPTPMLYAIERFSVNRFNAKLYLARSYKATKVCDGCGICIKKCPMHNISGGKNNRPVWGNNCMLCNTCELKCPKDAIKSPYDWAMNQPFYGMNIKRALKHQLPYAKIKFRNSRIEYS